MQEEKGKRQDPAAIKKEKQYFSNLHLDCGSIADKEEKLGIAAWY